MEKEKKMKNFFCIIISLLIISTDTEVKANPIAIYYKINELSFDSSGWKMEIFTNHFGADSVSLGGWILTSSTDTSYIKNNSLFNQEGYILLTNDDLDHELEINGKADTITLFSPDTLFQDILIFGNLLPNSVLSPKHGQSICQGYISAPYNNIPFLYLDNTPTFGKLNDTLNAKGYIEGYVKDAHGNPLKNVTVLYSYFRDYNYLLDSSFVLTDSSGFFRFRNYARISTIYFKKDNYIDSTTTLQIWPDSTVDLDDVKLITGIVENFPVPIAKDFNLSQNFPNPFNNSTSFFYTLPKSDNVEITIYDEKGALVQKLFSGYQSAGKYRVNWKTDNLASGVYIYQIRTDSFKTSKKAVLLK